MWQYVFRTLRRQPGKNALASGGFLLAACALILLSATTQTTVVQANQIISQSWRSSYDLVVLPSQAHLPSKNIIPGDLLEGYDGGISMQQYQQIKNLPGIAVAAPIAYIGYIQMPIPQLEFFTDPLPTGYYRIDLTLTAFDGHRQIVERTVSSNYYHLATCDMQQPTTKLAQDLYTKGVDLTCGTDPILYESGPIVPGTFLMAAIDPTAENQLVHLDKSLTSGRMLTAKDTIHPDFDQNLGSVNECRLGQEHASTACEIPNLAIPVLFQTQLPGQIAVKSNFTKIALGTLPLQTVLANGGATYLNKLPHQQSIFQSLVPLVQSDPQRFSSALLRWDGHSWQPYDLQIYGIDPLTASLKFLYTPSGLTYRQKASPDGQTSNAYTLVPSGVQAPEVAFRALHSLHIAERSKPAPSYFTYAYPPTAFYLLDPVGQFKGDTLAAQFSNPLNWLPENTYTFPPAVLRYDAQGNPVTPTNLLPTTNTAGYLLQPPLALTTLDAAVRLRGDHIISAIRIRVTGVDAANPASWKHIQQVAGLIQQRTHLQVLVTLGSSPRPTLVYIPGVSKGQFGAAQNIAPIGWVEERWIAIGVSILYLAQLGATRLLLLGAVLAVCLGYLVVAFSALVSAQRREFAILNVLGWRPWQPIRLFLAQALLLAIGGGIVGVGLALLISSLLEITPIWLIVIWTIPFMLAFALISVIYPLWQLWRMQPAALLRAGSTMTSEKVFHLGSRLGSLFTPIGMLVVRNLSRSRPRTLITILSLFFSALLLMVMFNGVLALRQTLIGTLLGNYVLLQTAVPQIAGCVFALLLTFLSVSDLLLLQVRTRQQEIGLLQAIGWRPWAMQQLFILEGLTLAVIGTVSGVLVSLWVLAAQHSVQNIVPLPLLACGAILLMLLVSALAILPALRAINRMQVVQVLRSE
ncbi:MAG: FtsX-like permease family protein [Ktedonobacteraceae bacterium]